MEISDCAQIDNLTLDKTVEVLESRFDSTDRDEDGSSSIYTWVGSLLLAMNPQCPRPHFYSDVVKTSFSGQRTARPHVFAVAQRMLDGLLQHRGGGEATKVTAILSGDSGSGKTETCRLIANYLNWLSSSGSGIEERLSSSGLVLECFGNAQTISNENSSRFGKLTSIFLDTKQKTPRIMAAQIQTYLLAKSRVAHLRSGEQNFHAFYTLVSDASQRVPHLSYKILGAEQERVVAFPMEKIKKALTTCGVSADDQNFIWDFLSSLLILGNVSFEGSNTDEGLRVKSDLSGVADLWGVSAEELQRSLVSVQVRDQRRLYNESEAAKARDALLKFLYACLFDWILAKMNDSLQGSEGTAGKSDSIQLLDIYGFEVEPDNGFEQFLINTANEKLQRFFLNHLALNEWSLLKAEGLVANDVKAQDVAQMCKETRAAMEERLASLQQILLSLHDSSHAPMPENTRDAAFTRAVANKLKEKRLLQGSFSFQHFAATLVYQTQGFCEANRDALSADGWRLIEKSRLRCKGHMPKLSSQYRSVGVDFSQRVDQLLSHLEHSSKIHFVRCLRANEVASPRTFDRNLVSTQLQHGGIMHVLECLKLGGLPCRVAKSSLRMRVASHLQKYLKDDFLSVLSDDRDLLAFTLLVSGLKTSDYRMGLANVFFRESGFSLLQRTIFSDDFWTTLDAEFIRRLWREKIVPAKWRRVSRSLHFLCRLRRLARRRRAALTIQRRMRMHLAAKELTKRRDAILALQRTWRRISFTRALLATPATIAGQELASYPSSDVSSNPPSLEQSSPSPSHPQDAPRAKGSEMPRSDEANPKRNEMPRSNTPKTHPLMESSPITNLSSGKNCKESKPSDEREKRERRRGRRRAGLGDGNIPNDVSALRRDVVEKRRLNRRMRQYENMRSRSVAPSEDIWHIRQGVSPPLYRTQCDEWFQDRGARGRGFDNRKDRDEVAAIVHIIDDLPPRGLNRRRRPQRSSLHI